MVIKQIDAATMKELEQIRLALESYREQIEKLQVDHTVTEWALVDIDGNQDLLRCFSIDAPKFRKIRDFFNNKILFILSEIKQSILFIKSVPNDERIYLKLHIWMPTIKNGYVEIKKNADDVIEAGNILSINYKKIKDDIGVDDIANLARLRIVSENDIIPFEDGKNVLHVLKKYGDMSNDVEKCREQRKYLISVIDNEKRIMEIPVTGISVMEGFCLIINRIIDEIERVIFLYTSNCSKSIRFVNILEDELDEANSLTLKQWIDKLDEILFSSQKKIIDLRTKSYYTNFVDPLKSMISIMSGLCSAIRDGLIPEMKSNAKKNTLLNPSYIAEEITTDYYAGFFGIFLGILSLLPFIPSLAILDKEEIKKIIVNILHLCPADISSAELREHFGKTFNKKKLVRLVLNAINAYRENVTEFIGQFEVSIPDNSEISEGRHKLGAVINVLEKRVAALGR